MEVVIGQRGRTNRRKPMSASAAAGRLQTGNARAPTLNWLEGLLLRLGVYTQRRRPREAVLEFDAMHNPLHVCQDKTFPTATTTALSRAAGLNDLPGKRCRKLRQSTGRSVPAHPPPTNQPLNPPNSCFRESRVIYPS